MPLKTGDKWIDRENVEYFFLLLGTNLICRHWGPRVDAEEGKKERGRKKGKRKRGRGGQELNLSLR